MAMWGTFSASHAHLLSSTEHRVMAVHSSISPSVLTVALNLKVNPQQLLAPVPVSEVLKKKLYKRKHCMYSLH